MKTPLFYFKYAALLLLIAGTIACKNRRTTTLVQAQSNDSMLLARANFIADSIARANYKPDTTVKLDTAKLFSTNPDYAFVHRCFENNCKQMEVIHFGIVNGFDKRVKLASKKMMSDHEKLNAALRQYAADHNVPLSNDTTIDMSFANTMDGVTWDSAWMDLVLTGQTTMRADFAQAQSSLKDEQLRNMVNGGLPEIDRHLEVAATLKKNY